MNEEILILGATGKTGRRLVPMLAGKGQSVKLASRSARPGHVHFDWGTPKTWRPALRNVGAIYLIAPDFVEDPSAEIAAFLDVARQTGVHRVVAVSSLGATFPGEPAGSGRRNVEAAIMGSGLGWTILRPSGFHQNFTEGFLAPGVRAGLVRSATAAGKTGLVDAHDIAAVAAVALTTAGHAEQTYAVTGPEPLSFGEAVALIGDVTGQAIAYEALSEAEFRALMHGFGLPPDYAAVIVRDQIGIRDGAGAQVTDVVERLTGRPPISFLEFARDAFAPRQRQGDNSGI